MGNEGSTSRRDEDPATEMLVVLLEVRAHVDSIEARVARMQAQLAHLDAQLERLERRRGVARRGARGTPRRAPTLLDLSSELLDRVVTFLDSDDELAASLACRKLRDAVRARPPPAQPRARRLETRARSVLGSLHKLQWGVACGAYLRASFFEHAAARGDVRMMSWLRARHCPGSRDSHMDEACAGAGAGGHLPALRWLHAHGCEWAVQTCYYAAEHGHVGILQWALDNECPWLDEGIFAFAAGGGQLRVLEWASKNRLPWDEQSCRMAAESGRLWMLRQLREWGCPWDDQTCEAAAEGGHLALLQWARANGCEWDSMTCSAAARAGHLAVLQWARAHGCPWDAYTGTCARLSGHEPTLQWARDNGCPV